MSFNRTSIDWPGLTHTWNPVTGCKRVCSYCYARKIHERFNKTPFSDIVFHPERLDKFPPKDAKRIFVGSMSDIDYWSYYETCQVVAYCRKYSRYEFMFLSKNPRSYWGFDWPSNTMQGLTIEMCYTEKTRADIDILIASMPRPYLSIEPILGIVDYSAINKFELIIVGAMTGPGAVPVKRKWIESVKANVKKDKLWFKNTIPREWL